MSSDAVDGDRGKVIKRGGSPAVDRSRSDQCHRCHRCQPLDTPCRAGYVVNQPRCFPFLPSKSIASFSSDQDQLQSYIPTLLHLTTCRIVIRALCSCLSLVTKPTARSPHISAPEPSLHQLLAPRPIKESTSVPAWIKNDMQCHMVVFSPSTTERKATMGKEEMSSELPAQRSPHPVGLHDLSMRWRLLGYYSPQ